MVINTGVYDFGGKSAFEVLGKVIQGDPAYH
jgi:iron complex transport system permease protein